MTHLRLKQFKAVLQELSQMGPYSVAETGRSNGAEWMINRRKLEGYKSEEGQDGPSL